MKLRLPHKLQAALIAAFTAVAFTAPQAQAFSDAIWTFENDYTAQISGVSGLTYTWNGGGSAQYTASGMNSGAAVGNYYLNADLGQAITFAAGQYLQVGGVAYWANGAGSLDVCDSRKNDYTVMAWVKFDSTTGEQEFFGTSDTANIGIGFGAKDGVVNAIAKYKDHNTMGTACITAGEWVNIAFSYVKETNTMTAYVNGVSVGTTNFPGGFYPTGGNASIIGGSASNTDRTKFAGQIAELKILDGAYSQQDILAAAHLTSTAPGQEHDYVWTGGVDANWDTATHNWKTESEESVVFVSGDGNTVTFNADGQQKDITLSTDAVVKAMTVDSATYTLNLNDRSLVALTLTINENATLTVGGSGSMTLDSLSGAGSLVKGEGSTVTIRKAASGYTGTITVNEGTLVAAADNAFGSSTNVFVGADGTLVLKTYTGVPSVTGSGTVQIDAGNGVSYEIHNKDFLEQFAGTVELVSGNLQVSNIKGNKFANAKLKLSGGEIRGWQGNFQHDILLNGGTIADANDNQEYSGAINVAANSTVNASNNHTITLSGAITGSAQLTKAGGGALTLTGNNTEFEGELYADAGTVNINSAMNLGSLRLGSATLNIKANTTVSGTLTIGPENNHYSGTLVVDADKTLTVNSVASPWGFNAISVNGTLTVTGSDGFRITSNQNNKVVNGTGTINTPKLIIGNANTKGIFAGGLTLNIGDGGIDGYNGVRPVEFRDVTVGVLNGSNGWSAANEIILAAGENKATTFEVGADKTVTLSGAVTGSGKLAKTGEGTTQVSGSMANYTGSVDVAEGTLNVLNAASLSVKDITIGTGATMGVYKNETATEANEGKVTMAANTTLKAGSGATLNADLEMQSGSTLTVADDDAWKTGGLTMGSSVYLNTGNLLGEGDLTTLNSLGFGDYYYLFSDVENLYINDTQVDKLDFKDWQHFNMDANQVFTNLNPQTYALVYNWQGGNVGSVALTLLPEPTTGTLSLLALCALAARRRRK